MSKKNFILIGLALVLAVVYVIGFTHWLRPKTIGISCTSRPIRSSAPGSAPVNALMFALNGDYELTEIKVVPLAALQTNTLATPVWHLVGDPNSDAIKHFIYGQEIDGLTSAIEGARPQPLQSGVTYRIFVTAGRARGQLDFHIGAVPANTTTNR